MLSKVLHREPVPRPYAAVSFRLCLAALELHRPAQKNAPRHIHGVLLVCETAGAELLNLVRVIAFRIVLPAIFSADLKRDILHPCCRREACAFLHVPTGRSYRGELLRQVCPRSCGNQGLSILKDYIVICRRYFSLYSVFLFLFFVKYILYLPLTSC